MLVKVTSVPFNQQINLIVPKHDVMITADTKLMDLL